MGESGGDDLNSPRSPVDSPRRQQRTALRKNGHCEGEMEKKEESKR